MKVLLSNLKTREGSKNENILLEAEAIIEFFKNNKDVFHICPDDSYEEFSTTDEWEYNDISSVGDYQLSLHKLSDSLTILNTVDKIRYDLCDYENKFDKVKTNPEFVELYNKIPYNKNNRFLVIDLPDDFGEVVYHRDDYFNEWITPTYKIYQRDYRNTDEK